jgi:hypothetical protein
MRAPAIEAPKQTYPVISPSLKELAIKSTKRRITTWNDTRNHITAAA